MRLYLLLMAYLIVVTGCSSTSSSETTEDVAPFFPLTQFLADEAERLQAANVTVQKTVSIDGKQEQQELSNPDFAREFSLLEAADINRPVWAEKYTIDTVLEGTLRTIKYTAKDPELATRLLSISYQEDDQEVAKIVAERKTKSVLSTGNNVYTYSPTQGYTIHAIQDRRTGGTLEIKIEGKFQ